jgi:lipoprotein-anchoring transpeptidase ErfK/SrfK
MLAARTAIAVAGLLLSGACATIDPAARRTPRLAAEPAPAVVATAGAGKLDVYARPGAARPVVRLSPRTAYGSPRVLLVRGQHGDWLDVFVPRRPNGGHGWVRRSDVSLTRTPYRVELRLAERELRVYRGTKRIVSTQVATGRDETPTPPGLFFVTDVVKVGPKTPWYGPYALGLSGYSPVLTDFAGGDGQIALHGTNRADQVGDAVSHGCVRLPNDVVTRLAKLLPLGTPVNVTA